MVDFCFASESKTIRGRKKTWRKVRAIFEDGSEAEWSGCGWVQEGRGKLFSPHDADMVAFDVNVRDGNEITAFSEEQKTGIL